MARGDLQSYYRTFSGTDAIAFLVFPGAKPVVLGSITTISYSIFREKVPVKLISRVSIPAYTKGLRYCAGTMIFTMINKHWVNELKTQIPWLENYGRIKADELPPMDIMIICANEYGASTAMTIYAAEMSDEAQTLSIEDIFTENQFSFIAKDIDTLDSDGTGKISVGGSSSKFVQPITSTLTTAMISKQSNINENMKQAEEVNRKTITIFVDGQKVEIPDSEPIQPYIDESGRVVAPLRYVFNRMGWEVEWDEPGSTATLYDMTGDFSKMDYDEYRDWPIYYAGVAPAIRKLVINHKNTTTRLSTVEENIAGFNEVVETDISLEVPPSVSKGRTIAQLRPLLEAIEGYSVTWGSGTTNTVYIETQKSDKKPVLGQDSNGKVDKTIIESAQALINTAGVKPRINVSGVYDYTTKWAVTSFQLQSGIEPNGTFDAATWNEALKQQSSKIDKSVTWPKNGKVIDKSGVKVRKTPNVTDNNILTVLYADQALNVYSDSGGWCSVTVKVLGIEIKGFIEKKSIMY